MVSSAEAIARFAAAPHDHASCVADAVTAAAELCAARGVRLTELRRRVLELVWRSHRPVGAYEILDLLRGDGRSAAPPTVYRALDFLLAQGLVHRLATRNAYIGCISPRDRHNGLFLICDECGNTLELLDEGIAGSVRRSAEELGFRVQGQTVEVKGLCPECGPECGREEAGLTDVE